MNELLKMILSLSLSGSLLIFVLLLCKPLIKDKLSKKWQYYIWLIVIARLVLPFAPETNLMRTLFQHFDNTVIQTNENQQTEQNAPPLFPVDPVDYDVQDIGAVCMSVWLIGAVALLIRKVTIYQSFVKYIKAGRLEVSDLALWEQVGEIVLFHHRYWWDSFIHPLCCQQHSCQIPTFSILFYMN